MHGKKAMRINNCGFFQKLSLKGICCCAQSLSNISSYSWKPNRVSCKRLHSVGPPQASRTTAGSIKKGRSWNPSFFLVFCRAAIYLCLKRSIFSYISIFIINYLQKTTRRAIFWHLDQFLLSPLLLTSSELFSRGGKDLFPCLHDIQILMPWHAAVGSHQNQPFSHF